MVSFSFPKGWSIYSCVDASAVRALTLTCRVSSIAKKTPCGALFRLCCGSDSFDNAFWRAIVAVLLRRKLSHRLGRGLALSYGGVLGYVVQQKATCLTDAHSLSICATEACAGPCLYHSTLQHDLCSAGKLYDRHCLFLSILAQTSTICLAVLHVVSLV